MMDVTEFNLEELKALEPKAVELKVTGDYCYEGKRVTGVQTTTWGRECLITKDVLAELLRKSNHCDALEKSTGYLMKCIKEGALSKKGCSDNATNAEVESLKKELSEARSKIAIQDARIRELSAWQATPDFTDLRKELAQRSVEVRRKKCMLGTAVALSCAIKGIPTKEITGILLERHLSGSPSFISKALSVRDKKDKERLINIMNAHPEEFEGLEEADFEKWYDERYRKVMNAARKRRITKAVLEAIQAEDDEGMSD